MWRVVVAVFGLVVVNAAAEADGCVMQQGTIPAATMKLSTTASVRLFMKRVSFVD